MRRALTLLVVLVVVGSAGAFGWARLHRPLDRPTIDAVSVLAPGEPDGSSQPAALATPRRIDVRFSVDHDLADVMRGRGLRAISAVLSACDGPTWTAEQVIAQRADYLADHGRVSRLTVATAGDRVRYRAVFDDRLTRLVDHAFERQPALGRAGGLCLTLRGAGFPNIIASSAVIRLPDLR